MLGLNNVLEPNWYPSESAQSECCAATNVYRMRLVSSDVRCLRRCGNCLQTFLLSRLWIVVNEAVCAMNVFATFRSVICSNACCFQWCFSVVSFGHSGHKLSTDSHLQCHSSSCYVVSSVFLQICSQSVCVVCHCAFFVIPTIGRRYRGHLVSWPSYEYDQITVSLCLLCLIVYLFNLSYLL